jgi:phospholipid/cholesterol/gamma-HCH transport system substrate-binding protein
VSTAITPSPATRYARPGLALALVLLLAAGLFVLVRGSETINRTNVVAYFENSNGIYVGDDVTILGVPVGQISAIEPEPTRVKVSFWYDSKWKVPASVNAAILSPMLVTSRAIQLTPSYSSGPVLEDVSVIQRDLIVLPLDF